MSSPRSEAPLRIEPRPSRLLAALVWAAHAGAAAVVPPLDLPPALRLLLVVAIAGHLVWCWPRLERPVRVVWDGYGDWTWEAGGRVAAVVPTADSYVSPLLVVLNLREPAGRRRHTLVLLPDSLDGETLRRLRARLRLAYNN